MSDIIEVITVEEQGINFKIEIRCYGGVEHQFNDQWEPTDAHQGGVTITNTNAARGIWNEYAQDEALDRVQDALGELIAKMHSFVELGCLLKRREAIDNGEIISQEVALGEIIKVLRWGVDTNQWVSLQKVRAYIMGVPFEAQL